MCLFWAAYLFLCASALSYRVSISYFWDVVWGMLFCELRLCVFVIIFMFLVGRFRLYQYLSVGVLCNGLVYSVLFVITLDVATGFW